MAITRDNSAQGTSGSTSFTTSGATRLLVLAVLTTSHTAATATYNGVSLTSIDQSFNGAHTNYAVQILYLKAPASGANTLAVTGSNKYTVVSYNGLVQGAPFDVSAKSSQDNSSLSIDITTTVNNDLGFAVFGDNRNSADEAVSGYTQIGSGQIDSATGEMTMTVWEKLTLPTAGTNNATMTIGGSSGMTGIFASFKSSQLISIAETATLTESITYAIKRNTNTTETATLTETVTITTPKLGWSKQGKSSSTWAEKPET